MDSDANPFIRDDCELTDLERAAFVEIVFNLVMPDSTLPVTQALVSTTQERGIEFCNAIQRKMRAAWRTRVI